MSFLDGFFVGHHHAMFDGSSQFPHVSWPRIEPQEIECAIAQGFDRTSVFLREFAEKRVRKEDNVLCPFAEGGHLDCHDV